mgnify:FL=1
MSIWQLMRKKRIFASVISTNNFNIKKNGLRN